MEIEGNKPNDETYHKEFHESVEIFEKSFKAIQASKFQQQKDTYDKAMKESLEAMQDSASALMNKHLLEKKDELQSHYQNYLQDPTEENKSKVEDDLNDLKSY